MLTFFFGLIYFCMLIRYNLQRNILFSYVSFKMCPLEKHKLLHKVTFTLDPISSRMFLLSFTASNVKFRYFTPVFRVFAIAISAEKTEFYSTLSQLFLIFFKKIDIFQIL